jgi:hypothetical protein
MSLKGQYQSSLFSEVSKKKYESEGENNLFYLCGNVTL